MSGASSGQTEVTTYLSKGPLRRFVDALVYIALSPYRAFKLICFLLGLSVMLLGLGITFYGLALLDSVPSVSKMSFEDLKAVATARVNERLEDKSRAMPWRELKDVSRDFVYGVVMSEDSTFFEHNGFNVDAIIDSVAENIKERRPAFGASTITQQVAKNLFLASEKTWSRKLKEVFLTRELEKKLGKNQILELYLNLAEFGPDVYGAEAAARFYFQRSSAQINAAQGAYMALMLPSPRRNHYSIHVNHNLTRGRKKRIQRVLNDLLYHELISEEQYQDYLRYPYFSSGNRAPASGSRR